MCIQQVNFSYIKELFHQKDEERNLILATFHMIAITLICMSMGDLTWFIIDGGTCVPYLTLGQFFWFGYTDDGIDYNDYKCLDSSIVNMMRIIILLLFMAILFSLLGFFLDIIGPRTLIYKMFRRYSVAGISTILVIMIIVTMSYYTVMLLQNSIEGRSSLKNCDVSYGFGFYLMTFAGCIEALGVLYSLMLPYKTSQQEDDRCLIDGFDDHFQSPTPPPPYSLPPPPYTP
ncbi:transmembrane protein 127-like [Euwallacea similis]|uniref:transmembrane protein 127-like n=1 Tax=Euwallacea similis TaxID=1736056 RepID=UPI00344CCC14